MSQLLAIKERIRTITNLRKVTRAMELVTRTKINRVRANAANARRYAEAYVRLFAELRERSGHPVVAGGSESAVTTGTDGPAPAGGPTAAGDGQPDTGVRYIIGFLSQKGFCGGFNDRALAAIRKELRTELTMHREKVELILVGRRNSKWSYALMHEFRHVEAPEKRYLEDLQPIVAEVSAALLAGTAESVTLVFNELVSILEQRPIVLRVVPAEATSTPDQAPGATLGAELEPETVLEPGASTLLKEIVPGYVEAQLVRAYWETVAGENCARLLSMKNANDNATTILDTLQVEYNKTRQMKITQELSEIISAFDVLRSIQGKHSEDNGNGS